MARSCSVVPELSSHTRSGAGAVLGSVLSAQPLRRPGPQSELRGCGGNCRRGHKPPAQLKGEGGPQARALPPCLVWVGSCCFQWGWGKMSPVPSGFTLKLQVQRVLLPTPSSQWGGIRGGQKQGKERKNPSQQCQCSPQSGLPGLTVMSPCAPLSLLNEAATGPQRPPIENSSLPLAPSCPCSWSWRVPSKAAVSMCPCAALGCRGCSDTL